MLSYLLGQQQRYRNFISQTLTSQPGSSALLANQYLLMPQQIQFFETFGFLKLPRLFANDIDNIIQGFIEQSPRLAPLQHDPSVIGVVKNLIGSKYKWTSPDK
jgi:hypothetical protein